MNIAKPLIDDFMNYRFITENSEFENFCRDAAMKPVVGIDTEFVWTKTYYPNLGLVQIAWDKEHCILADPLAVSGTGAFADLLADEKVVKVFHEAASDLPILYRWCGALPKNVVDTRLAAGFCGLTASLSLGKLLAMLLGVVLPKTETRTDWLQRPLTEKQLQYAGDDVVLLPQLFEKLKNRIEEKGHWQCFLDDMKEFENPTYYEEIPVEDSWKHVNRPGFLKFTNQDYAVLQQLASWREGLAREKNITRNRILKDVPMAWAAVKHPYTAEEVGKMPGMANTPAMKYCKNVADIVSAAVHIPKELWPELNLPPCEPRKLKQASDRIVALVKKRGDAAGIDSCIIASRREADVLATLAMLRKDCADSRLMNGWRHELLGKSVDEICKDLGRKK